MKSHKKSDAIVGEDKELEDEEEGILNPEDLSIIDEKTWEPSDEEILSYALKLGYDIEKDPDELFEVAYYYMKYPLPEGWKRAIYKKTKELMYINLEDGEIEIATEIEEMAHQMYLEKKEELINKGLLAKEDTKSSKDKIPPLNPLQKSNSSNNKWPQVLPPVKKSGSKNSILEEIENAKKGLEIEETKKNGEKIDSESEKKIYESILQDEKIANLLKNLYTSLSKEQFFVFSKKKMNTIFNDTGCTKNKCVQCKLNV